MAISDLHALALDAAHAGAEAILEVRAGGSLDVNVKTTPQDLVTRADRASEKAIIRLLRGQRPHDEILAEESGLHTGVGSIRWIVDPLDGTTNFVHRRPDFAVTVAVQHDGRTTAAAIVRPVELTVFTEVPEGAFDVLDTGKRRNAADVLA